MNNPLFHLKEKFESILTEEVASFEESSLGAACRYALLNGGKRVRPLLVYALKDAMGSTESLDDAALAIEFFHSASLIADDLPCMDNEEFRREVLTTHKKFGEATALLASYALIVAAFEKIHHLTTKSSLVDKETRGILALKEVSFAAGMLGATGGQFLDLFSKKRCLNEISKIIEKKTVRLFEVSFLLAWIFGGGELSKVEEVRSLGYNFGFAFQLADDLIDIKEDVSKESKSNFALFAGEGKTRDLLKEHLRCFENALESLCLKKELFLKIEERLWEKIPQSLKT